MKYCFVFVCQGGQLEWMSCLLAASLRQNLLCDYELVAAIPSYDQVQQPKNETIAFLQSVGVRTCPIYNYINVEYPIANKLSCIDISNDADKLVFLDSDLLCSAEFHHQPEFEDFQFLAKLTDLADLSLTDWQIIHSALNIPMPTELLQSTVTKETMPLCFNSGFIAVDTGLGFGRKWIEIAQRMEAINGLPGARPFLDQLSLPFALLDLGLSYYLLDEAYNFPAEIRGLNFSQPPFFSHYHHSSYLLAEPILSELVRNLFNNEPALLNVSFPPHISAIAKF